jgi:Flp pilus assembly protein TadD
LEKRSDQQTGTKSKIQIVEQINVCLRSGNYSRAMDLLRGTASEFPNDGELSELEKLARDGIKRNADAQRLITESQELFAQQKSNEAIQLLREAYDLDKNNSLSRAILANALVEHAHSVVETDWLEAETLTNQALKLNPAHPTANTIRSLIVEQKKTSSVEDWVARARQLQSSGDLFAAMAWLQRAWLFIPTIPSCFRFMMRSSVTRPLGDARPAAAMWKTCGA